MINLTQEQLMKIHASVIDPGGHEIGVRSWGILYMIPQYSKNKELFTCAATLAVDISELQPFLDGNRRTAFVAGTIVLRMGGYKLKPRDIDMKTVMTDIKDGLVTVEQLTKELKIFSKPKPPLSFEDSLIWILEKFPDIIHHLEGLKDQ